MCTGICWIEDLGILFLCFKQKTAYEMRISDWSSDVCSSDLRPETGGVDRPGQPLLHRLEDRLGVARAERPQRRLLGHLGGIVEGAADADADDHRRAVLRAGLHHAVHHVGLDGLQRREAEDLQRSADHTSELQSIMRNSYS